MRRRGVIKCWSAIQATIALSSGEAEYYGVVKRTGVGLGQQALGKDGGFILPVRVWTDSSAAMGTASRQGLGKMRHLECHSLWLQQRLRRKEFELRKVDGTANPADLFTKHMDSASKLQALVALFGCEYRDGRPESAPKLKRAPPTGAVAASLVPAETSARALKVLPHLLPASALSQAHPAATAEDSIIPEEDVTP